MLVTERQLNRYKNNIIESWLNAGMASFDLNFNNTAREPEDEAIFLDDIGALDIDFGSECCIYQLLDTLKMKVGGSGSGADFYSNRRMRPLTTYQKGRMQYTTCFKTNAHSFLELLLLISLISPACIRSSNGGTATSREEWNLTEKSLWFGSERIVNVQTM